MRDRRYIDGGHAKAIAGCEIRKGNLVTGRNVVNGVEHGAVQDHIGANLDRSNGNRDIVLRMNLDDLWAYLDDL